MAEYLDVTEEFLKEALECYNSKYGTAVRFDNYIIGFEPRLYVMELFQWLFYILPTTILKTQTFYFVEIFAHKE